MLELFGERPNKAIHLRVEVVEGFVDVLGCEALVLEPFLKGFPW
jgi:hypothetical protein